jgi:hypothetical protein
LSCSYNLTLLAGGQKDIVDCDRDRLCLRVLIEIEEQTLDEAMSVADGIFSVLALAELKKPILLHGFDDTVWPFVERGPGGVLDGGRPGGWICPARWLGSTCECRACGGGSPDRIQAVSKSKGGNQASRRTRQSNI